MPDDVAHFFAGVLDEIQGPALRDDTELLHDLIMSHTCACALDRKGVSGHNDFEADAQQVKLSGSRPCRAGGCLEDSELLGGTWSVGNELLTKTSLPVHKGSTTMTWSSFVSATAANITRMQYLCNDRSPRMYVLMDQSKVTASEWETWGVVAVGSYQRITVQGGR